MEDEHLDTIQVTESANTIKSSVDDLVPTPSEFADLSNGESKCNVPINDDSPESHFTTFSNPLFDSNDDFSSDDESLSEEEIQKDKFKYFSNPLYDLDDEIITNEKFLPNQKDLDFIDSIFDEFSLPRPPEIPSFSQDVMDLVFDDSIPPGIDDDDDSEGDILPLEELLDDVLFLPKSDNFTVVEPVATMENNIEELNEDESFDPGGGGNVVLPNVEEDDTFTLTIRTFLPFVTYPEDSPLLLSSGSEDTIFDPGISTFHFSSLKPVAYENPMVIFLIFCFCPKDKGIRGEIPQDHEDPCLFSILQSSGLRSFAYFGILNPDHGWMMMENKRCGELMIENHGMDKLLKEVLMVDELSIVETDKVKRIENEAKTVAGTRYEVLYTSVSGTVHVSTRYCSGGDWTNQMVTRGTGVCQSEVL
ncbi:hypothetical protein Tco_0351099 [Tanacetum coccineum]